MIDLYQKALTKSREMEVLLVQANELILLKQEESLKAAENTRIMQEDTLMEDVKEGSIEDEDMVSKSRQSSHSSFQSNASHTLSPGMQVAVRPDVSLSLTDDDDVG
jgi:hypothetical protein